VSYAFLALSGRIPTAAPQATFAVSKLDERETVMLEIREATREDFDLIWPFFQEIVCAGETYAFPRVLSQEQGAELWMDAPQHTFVAEEAGKVLGSYYIKANALGPGSHVCNCGYMVSSRARGRGLATSMCVHSQRTAVALGYRAMQFNSVVATNTGAIQLWERLGFETVGRLPKAFLHPEGGHVDCLVMYKWLLSGEPEGGAGCPPR
jgi:ribosomal protein S18 acetylase RimI-like enzyme